MYQANTSTTIYRLKIVGEYGIDSMRLNGGPESRSAL